MRGVDLEGARIDVHEHGCGAEQQRNFRGRGICERRQEDSVTAPDIFGHQRNLQRVCAGADADAMTGAAKSGQFGLELADLGAKDELAMLQHLVQTAAQIGGDTGLLGFEVEKRNRLFIRHRIRKLFAQTED